MASDFVNGINIGDAGDTDNVHSQFTLLTTTNSITGSTGTLPDESDWYRFTAPETGTLFFEMFNLSADLDIYVYDDFGNYLTSSENGDTSAESLYVSIEQGESYFIEIFPFDGGSNYSLNISFDTPPPGAAETVNGVGIGDASNTYSEPSDFTLLATAANSITGSTGILPDDVDYFRFVAPESGTLLFGLSGFSADLDIYLYDILGNDLAYSSNPGTVNESMYVDVTEGEVYIFEVFPYGGGSDYFLDIAYVGTPSSDGDHDIVNGLDIGDADVTPERAATVSFDNQGNALITGSTGYVLDYRDWYTFLAPVAAQLTLSLTGLAADLDLYLFDDGGFTPIVSSENSDNTNESITYQLTPDVTYLIAIDPFDGESNYSLALNLDTLLPVPGYSQIVSAFVYENTTTEVTLFSNTADAVMLNTLIQQAAPDTIPDFLDLPLGLISFDVTVSEPGKTEYFSILIDDALPVDGYYKQDSSGSWVNLASAVSYVDGKIRVEFSLTDGGEFDADGLANGIITDPGAPGDGDRPQLELRDKVLALYIAYFNRAPDADGMEFWLTQAENGQSLYDISAGFANHPVFTQEYGGLSTREIVEQMYLNVLHRPGDEGGINFWVDQVDNQGRAVSEIFVDFVVGAIEIDLETYFREGLGGNQLTAEEYTVAFERQKIIENLMQASEHFLEVFGDATIPQGPPETVTETAAYQASIAVLAGIDSDLNMVFDQRDALVPLVGQADVMEQVLDLLS